MEKIPPHIKGHLRSLADMDFLENPPIFGLINYSSKTY
jgi:hypothetical protein